MRASVATLLGAAVGAATGAAGSERRVRGAIVGGIVGGAAAWGLWRFRPVDLEPDAVTLTDLEPSARAVFERVKVLAAREGYRIRYVSGRRTCAEQNALYAQGRTAPGAIVTDAKGCKSWHVQGRAVDFEVLNKGATAGDYARVGAIAESLGAKWGGRFVVGGVTPDRPHLEYHPGLTIEQACAITPCAGGTS